jgi:hypothetical protein
MNKSEFLQESLSFQHGEMVFVAGPDLGSVVDVLEETVDYIEANSSSSAILFDSSSVVLYPERRHHFVVNQDNDGPGVVQARSWEYVHVVSQGSFVSLVAHELSEEDPSLSLAVNVVLDLHRIPDPVEVPQGASRAYAWPGGLSNPGFREMVPFVDLMYHFSPPDSFTYIKRRG